METFNYGGKTIKITQDTFELERYEKDSATFMSVDLLFLAMKGALKSTADFHNHMTEGKTDPLGNPIARIFPAKIYLTDEIEDNAFSTHDGKIIVSVDLILDLEKMVIGRFTDRLLREIGLCETYSPDMCRLKILRFACCFIALHEQFHIWHHHLEWESMYSFSGGGEFQRGRAERTVLSEAVTVDEDLNAVVDFEGAAQDLKGKYIKRMTEQALEMDADCSAAKTMVMILGIAADVQRSTEKEALYWNELPLIYAGIATTTYMMDQVGGKVNFKNYRFRLVSGTHPIPAIRLFMIEGELGAVMTAFMSEEKARALGNRCNDVLFMSGKEELGNKDSWNIYYYVAYTRFSQGYVINLRKKFNEMYDTLYRLSEGVRLSPFMEEDLVINPFAVWFDDVGNSLRGWINPISGTTSFDI